MIYFSFYHKIIISKNMCFFQVLYHVYGKLLKYQPSFNQVQVHTIFVKLRKIKLRIKMGNFEMLARIDGGLKVPSER